MELLWIVIAALAGSALTFFSGFGLGTLLVPVFALFFSIDIAIACTAVVHFSNNLFKLFLVGKSASTKIVLRFGLPSLLAALAGAFLLRYLGTVHQELSLGLGQLQFETSVLKLVLGLVIAGFALVELLPQAQTKQLSSACLPFGGLLSGFFGGLTGNQGALRSLFLLKAGLSKEAFVASGVVIACMVDFARISVYSSTLVQQHQHLPYTTIGIACLSAFTGAYFGNKLVKKITLRFLQIFVSSALALFGLALALGFL